MVEGSEDEGVGGERKIWFGVGGGGDGLEMVGDLVGVGKVGKSFGEVALVVRWSDNRVGDDVVEKIGASGAGITKPTALDWGGSKSGYFKSGTQSVSLEID